MTEDDLDAKFGALADRLLKRDRQAAIKKLIFECEKSSARDFMKGLVV